MILWLEDSVIHRGSTMGWEGIALWSDSQAVGCCKAQTSGSLHKRSWGWKSPLGRKTGPLHPKLHPACGSGCPSLGWCLVCMFNVWKYIVEMFNVPACLKPPYPPDSQAPTPWNPVGLGMLQTACISAVRGPATPKSRNSSIPPGVFTDLSARSQQVDFVIRLQVGRHLKKNMCRCSAGIMIFIGVWHLLCVLREQQG